MNLCRPLFLILCLVSLVSFAGFAAPQTDKSATPATGGSAVAATVAKVAGNVQVLRNPRAAPLTERAMPQGASQAKFSDKFWESYDLVQGSQVYYGDLLSASSEGKTQMRLVSGFKIVLAPNAKLRITRQLLDKQVNSPRPKTIVDLIIGSLRARSQPDAVESDTEFRSRTMVMGARGTDFSIIAMPQETQIAVVEGEVAVRNSLRGDASEVVIRKGEATVVAHPPETQDVAALAKELSEAEYKKLVAAYDPKPPRPVTAAQAKKIRDFSDGVSSPDEQRVVDELIVEKVEAEKTAQNAGRPLTDQKPVEKPEPERAKTFAVEGSVGRRRIDNSDAPELKVSGIDIRLAADWTPFSLPLAFGLAYSETEFNHASKFNDTRLSVDAATESVFAGYVRYTYALTGPHALFGRLGLRKGELKLSGHDDLDGRNNDVSYDTNSLWGGFGYQWTFWPDLTAVAQLEAMPGSIRTKGNWPADHDLTRDPDGDAWGGGAVSLGLRYLAF
jgi:hypothetical protein